MPIVLVTNIITTLSAINYFTKTFITDIWQDRKSDSTFWKKKNITFNFPWIIHQYPCFFINILGVLGILERQKKIRKQKNEFAIGMLIRHVDGKGSVEKRSLSAV